MTTDCRTSSDSPTDVSSKVSVLIVTYNHEAFIAQAIESVLMQEVDFDYEVVIAEDCSTDNTREIVIGYQERYPDKIRLILSERNLGNYGGAISARALPTCRGQYIALLEGDDYWTDPHKLQKQVDFLDSHPDFSICSHNVYIEYEGQSKPMVEWLGSEHKEVMTIEDLLGDGTGGATCSLVFRNGVFGELPDWFSQIAGGDTALQILCASKGKMRYFREVMGVYRKHSSGATAHEPDSQAEIDAYESGGVIKYEIINKHFNYRYDRLIRRMFMRYHYPNLLRAYTNNWARCIKEAHKYARKIVAEDPSVYRIAMRKRIRLTIFIAISDLLILLHKIIARLLI